MIELIWGSHHDSPAWRGYTGLPETRWHEAVVPEDLAHCTHALGDALRLGSPAGCDARLRSSSGEDRWFRIVFSPAPADRWFACAHGLDDRLVAARSRRWIATVAHELRAPLTAMLLWERVLRDPSAGSDRHAQALQAIRDSAAMQARIVEDLVLLSRSASGRLRVEPRRVDLAAIVRAAVAAAELDAGPRGVTITAELDASCTVHGDPLRLRQIIDNVLANSLKFGREGGTVAVTVRSADDHARVSVRDDGEGIPAELLPHVFEPFAGVPGSLGLGLAIAHELAELQGGSLAAESAGAGHGATFTLFVPLAAAAPSSVGRTDPPAPESAGNPD